MSDFILSRIQDNNKQLNAMYGGVNPMMSTEEIIGEENYTFKPSYEETWDAAFNQYGLAEPILKYFDSQEWVDEEGYDAIADPQLQDMPGLKWRFLDSNSSQETRERLSRFKQELTDIEILNNSEFVSPAIIASVLSPVILAPVAPLSIMRNAGLLTRFAGGAAFTAALYAPEEFFITSQSETRTFAQTALALSVAGLIGGGVASTFGGRNFKTIRETIDAQDGKIRAGVGANLSPSLQRRSMYDMMERDALVETGIGIEKLPWNPVIRMTMSKNPIVRNLAAKMVDMGGLIQKKVVDEQYEAMDQSVEVTFRTKFLSPLIQTMQFMDKQYLKYRGVVAKSGDISRSAQKLGLRAKDIVTRSNKLSENEFRRRVTQAVRNGADLIDDEATVYVNASAKRVKKHFDFIKREAQDSKLFEIQFQKVIKGLRDKLAQTTDDAQKATIEEQIQLATRQLQRIREGGVTVNTAMGYVPRIYRVDKLIEGEERFIRIVEDWAMSTYQLGSVEAKNFAREMHDIVSKNKPFLDIEDGMSQIDWITQASSTKARTFAIPDELIKDFLEDDIEMLLRHHTKTMGMDIQLTLKFGDVSMGKVVKEIQDEYKVLLKNARSGTEKSKLKEALKRDIEDVKGLRDRLRGTYGASKDPHSTSSRVTRAMKSFNVLVGMGSATITSIPDVVRTIMVEGLGNTYEKGLRTLISKSATRIKAMKRKEFRSSAVAADAVLGLRAAQFSDIGDMFGSRMSIERTLSQSTNIFFILNGLNYWNQMMKEFAGTVTMLRMTDSIMKPFNRLSKEEREKLLKNGIDAPLHGQMQQLIRKHGKKVDGEWFPNTDFWTNAIAVRKFRNALNQNVDRIIITPGAGDRALWTSTELGSLITQFKGYAQGAMVRLLTSGLQEKSMAFWQGATLLIGLAAIVNEFKRLQYGITREEGFDEKFINAIDRSGVTGWFLDVNNTLEKMSDYKFGLRPLLTDKPSYNLPFGAKAGALFGPGAQNISTAGSVFTDLVRGEANEKTLKSARFIIPGGNLPYLDPINDGIFGK